MWPNPQDLVTLTEEILNGKLHFLYSERNPSEECRNSNGELNQSSGNQAFYLKYIILWY